MVLIFFLTLIALAILTLVFAFYEAHRFQITPRTVKLTKPLARPLRILHLSDIHFWGPNPKLFQFFDRLAAQPLDFVFVTGDILDGAPGLKHCLENLTKFKPAYGTYAVFGNHDYFDYTLFDVFFRSYEGGEMPERPNITEELASALTKAGIRVLRNQSLEVSHAGTPILIHGVDDPVTGHANIRTTLANFDPNKINFLLTHTVDAFLDIGENEIDVSFSGHLHGGQICAPFFGPLWVPTVFGRSYASGLKELKGAKCSISRGLGTSHLTPFRLFAPPEAIVVEVL